MTAVHTDMTGIITPILSVIYYFIINVFIHSLYKSCT